jgi:mannose-6-phosphate isomerase
VFHVERRDSTVNGYPIRFKPILKERVWGGIALARHFNRAVPEGKRIGESWELVDRPPDASIVDNGPLAGQTLHQLCAQLGRRLLGERAPTADSFPLIVKLLDPNDRLSVQVHPTIARTQDGAGRSSTETTAPKTEMWYALDAAPGAQIIQGLKPGVTADDLEFALTAGDIEPLLRFVDVEPGGFYHVPSGLVHALLPGSLMVEIQQNSDTTFRLYDWGRVGLDGKPRALHVAQALEAVRAFLADPALSQSENLGPLALSSGLDRVKGLATPYFVVEEIAVPQGAGELRVDQGSFTILIVTGGRVTARCGPGLPLEVELAAGDTALVPAGTEVVVLQAVERTTLLTAALPRSSDPRG